MSLVRLISALRLASSMMTRSPCALVCFIKTPDSSVALAWRARVQFSALARAIFSSSAFFLAASAASAAAFFSSSSLSLPAATGLAAGLDAAAAGVAF